MTRVASREERGAIIILAAVSWVALCMSAALAFDLGNMAQLHRHAQSAVENAALSGADLLAQGTDTLDQVATSSESYVDENWADAYRSQITSGAWDDCSTAPTGFSAPTGSGEDCVTFNGSTTATTSAISVVFPPQSISFTLARAGGFTSAAVHASATALVSGGTFPCALCLLGPTGITLGDSASGSLTVTATSGDAGIAVDSTSTPAAQITASGSVTASQIDVSGSDRDSGSGKFNPTPTTGTTPVPDPLASLVPPTPGTATIPVLPYINSGSANGGTLAAGTYGSILLNGSGSVTIPPGNYSSITISGSGSLTLESGTYYMAGGFSVSASGSVHETSGVLLYFTCSLLTQLVACASGGQSGGFLSLTGSGSVTLSPLVTGADSNLTVFYDRNDDEPIDLTASGSLSVSGTIYAKSSALDVSGSGGTLSSLVVVSSATVSGSGSVGVSYNPAKNVTPPSSAYLCSASAGNC